MAKTPILLSTRPAPDNAMHRFAQSHGFDVLNAPVLEIVPLSFQTSIPDRFNAIFTSAHAVHAAIPKLAKQPNRCAVVGQRTADALGDYGLAVDIIAPTAAQLTKQLAAAQWTLPLVQFRGQHSAADFSAIPNIISTPIVYDQVALDWSVQTRAKLKAAAKIGQWVVAPLYSPRSAQLFCKQIAHINKPKLCIAAISYNAALQVQNLATQCGIAPAAFATAPTPDQSGMNAALCALKQCLYGRL